MWVMEEGQLPLSALLRRFQVMCDIWSSWFLLHFQSPLSLMCDTHVNVLTLDRRSLLSQDQEGKRSQLISISSLCICGPLAWLVLWPCFCGLLDDFFCFSMPSRFYHVAQMINSQFCYCVYEPQVTNYIWKESLMGQSLTQGPRIAIGTENFHNSLEELWQHCTHILRYRIKPRIHQCLKGCGKCGLSTQWTGTRPQNE